MTNYDENLKDNLFYMYLLDNHIDIVEKASVEGWLICIPRKCSIRSPISDEQIFDHILIATSTNNLFTTLNKSTVVLQDNKFNDVRILFMETVYLKQYKFKVFCIEHLLTEKYLTTQSLYNINSLRDCIDLLWFETLGRQIMPEISEVCDNFLNEHKSLQTYSLVSLRDYLQGLFMKCLLLPLKFNTLREKTSRDETLLKNLKLSVETFMQHCLNNKIFDVICMHYAHDDSNFNKTVRNLQELQLKQLNLCQFQDCIANAKYELSRINKFSTTLGKLSCLQSAFNLLSANGNNVTLTSEELLQLFAFLIIKLNINNWVGNLIYLQDFTFSTSVRYDKRCFLITTFEAAIEYIKSGALYDNINIKSDNLLFESIRDCNLELIKSILKDDRNLKREQMCHPLCSCDKCEALVEESNEFTINFCDDKGRNCLHYACRCGCPPIVEFFINKGIEMVADYSGSYPIHYAASRGHQSALLLLLNADADLNILDADGNTPLHLACNNGHENCVKALLHYSESRGDIIDINCTNSLGNSCLHLAARWGYLNLVKLLFTYKINPYITNKRNQRAVDLTGNYYIKQLLSKINGNNPNSQIVQVNSSHDMSVECGVNFGVRPKNEEQFKKVDLLLKAIENNDLPLTCFYLNIPQPPPVINEENCCHPLCDCEKCVFTESAARNTHTKNHLNVNICNANGSTGLHCAANFGRKEILRLLLDAGANVNLQTYKTFYTPLHCACINQRIDIVKELLKCGACNVDVQDGYGNTPLHYGCLKNDARIVEVLTSESVDLSIKNYNGRTALQEAEMRNYANIVRLLKDKRTSSYNVL